MLLLRDNPYSTFTELVCCRCDAEPEALATYIIALLKHDVPEQDLRQEVVKQLDEFFENGACVIDGSLYSY